MKHKLIIVFLAAIVLAWMLSICGEQGGSPSLVDAFVIEKGTLNDFGKITPCLVIKPIRPYYPINHKEIYEIIKFERGFKEIRHCDSDKIVWTITDSDPNGFIKRIIPQIIEFWGTPHAKGDPVNCSSRTPEPILDDPLKAYKYEVDHGVDCVCSYHIIQKGIGINFKPEPTRDDLLDAICIIESGPLCDSDTQGDCTAISGPPPKGALVSAQWTSDENGNFLSGHWLDCKAVGSYQIHKIYVDDVNRILGEDRYNYSDRWNKAKSREMTSILITHYGKGDIELMARSHRKPSDPYGEGMDEYWKKVQKVLYK